MSILSTLNKLTGKSDKSVLAALNSLTGKEADDIEEAMGNLSTGGSSDTFGLPVEVCNFFYSPCPEVSVGNSDSDALNGETIYDKYLLGVSLTNDHNPGLGEGTDLFWHFDGENMNYMSIEKDCYCRGGVFFRFAVAKGSYDSVIWTPDLDQNQKAYLFYIGESEKITRIQDITDKVSPIPQGTMGDYYAELALEVPMVEYEEGEYRAFTAIYGLGRNNSSTNS